MEWHEDDAFWEAAAPWMFSRERWLLAESEVLLVESLLGLTPAARVLDLCCGPGRHSLELAKRGYNVVGLDRTASYLEEARLRAERASLTVGFLQGDARTPAFDAEFDACINMYTSFGYFDDETDDRKMAEAARQALVEGGQFLVNVLSKDTLRTWFQPQNWLRMGNRILLGENRIIGDDGSIENRWTLIDGAAEQTLKFTVRLYSEAEMEALLLAAGFSSVRCYGSLNGEPVGAETRRLVAVAVR